MLPLVSFPYLKLGLLVALGLKPMRLRGLLSKLSASLLGYLLPPLKKRFQGELESLPIPGEPFSLISFLPLGVTTPELLGGLLGSTSLPCPLGRVEMGFRLGFMLPDERSSL
jgi:hypothetical protein